MGIAGQISVLMTVQSKQYTAGFQAARISNEKLASAAKRTGLSVGRLNNILRKVTEANFAALSPARQLQAELRGLKALWRGGALSLTEYNAAQRSFIRNARAARFSLTSILKPLGVFKTVLLGLAAARVFGKIFEQFGDAFALESQLKRATAVFGELTEAQEKAFKSASQYAGFDLGVGASATEAAKGLEQLGRDGQGAEEALKNLIPLLQFAQASNLDVAAAAEISSDVYTAFGLKIGTVEERARKLADTYDLLTKASLSADVTAQQLGESLIKSAPLFTQLNVSMTEAAALQTTLAELGRKGFVGGQEAQRGIRDLLRVFADEEDTFKNVFGIDFFEGGEFVGIETALKRFESLFENLNTEDQLEFLRGLGFQERALRTIQQLIGKGSEVGERANDLITRQGETARVAVESRTSIEKLGSLVSSTTGFVINATLVAGLEKIAGGFVYVYESVQYAILIFGKLGPVMRFVTITLVALTTAVVTFGATLAISIVVIAFAQKLALLTTAMGYASAALGVMTAAWRALGSTVAIVQYFLLGIGGPATWAALAVSIAAASAAAYGIARAFDSVTEAAEGTSLAITKVGDSFESLTAGQKERVVALAESTRLLEEASKKFGPAFRLDPFRGTELRDLNKKIREQLQFPEQTVKISLTGKNNDLANLQETQSQIRGALNQFAVNARVQAENAAEEVAGVFFDKLGEKLIGKELQGVKGIFEQGDKLFASIETPAEKSINKLKILYEFFEKIDNIRKKGGALGDNRFTPEVQQRLIQEAIDLGTDSKPTIANAGALVRGSIAELNSRFTVSTQEGSVADQSLAELKAGNKTAEETRALLEQVLADDERDRLGAGRPGFININVTDNE